MKIKLEDIKRFAECLLDPERTRLRRVYTSTPEYLSTIVNYEARRNGLVQDANFDRRYSLLRADIKAFLKVLGLERCSARPVFKSQMDLLSGFLFEIAVVLVQVGLRMDSSLAIEPEDVTVMQGQTRIYVRKDKVFCSCLLFWL